MTRIVSRSEWGARHGNGNDVSRNMPWGEVVFHTEAGAIRKEDWEVIEAYANGVDVSSVSEKQWMLNVENFHVNTRGWNGIAYSFLISFDGTIYEGRGWGRQGAHTENRNSTAAGVCFRGHGDLQEATPAQIASAQWLIGEGIRLGKLKPNPKISSHSDYSLKGKTCCGLKIRPILGVFKNITGPSTSHTPTPSEEDISIMDKATQDFLTMHFEAIKARDEEAEQKLKDLRGWLSALARVGADLAKRAGSSTWNSYEKIRAAAIKDTE